MPPQYFVAYRKFQIFVHSCLFVHILCSVKKKCVSVYGVLHFILRQFLRVSADLNTVGVLPFCHAALHQIIVV